MSPNAKQKKKAGAQDMLYGTTLSAESIKVMAESSGVNSLCDDAAKELAESVSTQIKKVVECSMKFMHHSKRDRLTTNDIDSALRVFNVEPHYGFVCKTFTPFRFASGGGRELHFNEEREVDLKEVIDNSSQIKFPLELSIRAHWLAVDGIQPLIPENPPPLSKEAQALESVNPVAKLEQGITKESAGKPAIGKIHKLRNVETVHVKQLATHELSVEQQLYYKEITEACVGSDEPRRGEALQSLSSDPGLHEMLPRMCTFIAEGVKVNVVQNNLALLIYLMRMVKALLDNPSLYLEKYLHEILPSVTTCIVSRQMCMRPEIDNHWALRDFASRLMAQICKNFNTSTNNLQTRVTRIYSKALTNDKTHLSTLYGSLAGLAELGGEVVKVFIIPRLRFISERIESHLLGVTTTSGTDKTAAGHIRAMLQKCCPPVLRQIRNPPDLVEDYKNDYGFMGPSLCAAVQKSRTSPSSTPLTSSSFTTISSGPVTLAAQNVTKRVQMGAQTTRQTGTVVATMPQMRALQQTQPTKFIVMPQQQQQQQQQTQQKAQIKQMVETTSPLTVVVGGEAATQASMLISRQSPVPMIMHSPNSATSSVRLIKPTAQTTSPVFFTRQMSQSPAVYAQGISPQSVLISHDHDMGLVGTIAQDGSDIVVTQDDAVSEDVETVIIEDEEMHPPPELDDLSHLE